MVGRIRNMVLDVLLFSKDRDLKKERTSVAAFTSDTARGIRALVEEHGIGFSLECPEEAGEFEVDTRLLRTSLVNVLENAVDACLEDRAKASHRITFQVLPAGDHVVFRVEDDGIGMDAETRKRMCTLFFSSKERKGTGLGLYITDRTVRQHGGTLTVDSEPGRGTAIDIRLPRSASDAAAGLSEAAGEVGGRS
jgi:signal transduction histidine kinase